MILGSPGGVAVKTDTVPAIARPVPTPALYLTTIALNRTHPDVAHEQTDVCAMHSRVIDITTGMPDDGPRILWATPARDLLVIRTPDPITTARLPAGYATAVSCRPWTMPTRPGRYRMVGVLNPGRHARAAGPTLNQPDRPYIHLGPKLVAGPDGQKEWLQRRLCAAGDGTIWADDLPAAARIDTFRVIRRWIATGRHRSGRTITVRELAVAADVDVLDPAIVCRSVVGGIGIDKTWGSGLTLWETT